MVLFCVIADVNHSGTIEKKDFELAIEVIIIFFYNMCMCLWKIGIWYDTLLILANIYY